VSTETLISDKSHFPNVEIYLRAGASGKPVYRLVFRNLEYVAALFPLAGRLINYGGGAILFLVLIFSPLIIIAPSAWMQGAGYRGAIVGLAAVPVFGLYVFAFLKLKNPRKTKREIELDYDKDELRIYINGRPSWKRQLSRLESLTIEPHPQVEYARMRRQERGKKKLSDEEKSHELFGYFGEGGAEKVWLVSRAEWPNHNSLREVRAAIIWARNHAGGVRADAGHDFETPETKEGGTIKPPLD
jgi:hypothetical protein